MDADILKLALWIEARCQEQVAIDRLALEWVRAGRPRVGGPEGAVLAFVEPELRERFPDSESVNRALRSIRDIENE